MRLESLTYNGDGFGDEDKGFDLIGSSFLLFFIQKNITQSTVAIGCCLQLQRNQVDLLM